MQQTQWFSQPCAIFVSNTRVALLWSNTTVTVVDDRCETSQQEWVGERMAEDNGQAEEILEAVGAVRALDTVHARIGGYFHRREMRERVRRYLVGLLGHVERKNSWQLAEAFGEAGPQGVQRLFTA